MADAPKPPPEDIDAAIERILAANQTTSKKTGFIGLPSSATANDTGEYMDEPMPTAPGQKGPAIYRDGAQNMPIMSNWDKAKVSALQKRLVQSGALDDDYLDGYWDPVSAKAFEQILAESNNMGTPDFNLAIDARINSQPMEIGPDGKPRRRPAGSSAKNKRPPLSLTLSNSDDLATTAQTVAQKRLGRTFNADELNRFVSSYHAAESGSQRSQYNASDPSGSGGTTEGAPSPETAANTFAEHTDPVASQARNMLPMVQSINNLLNGADDVNTQQPLQGGF